MEKLEPYTDCSWWLWQVYRSQGVKKQADSIVNYNKRVLHLAVTDPGGAGGGKGT